jgi:hypothetical protein
MNKTLIGIIVIVIAAAGIFAFFHYKKPVSNSWNEGDAFPSGYNGIIEFYSYDCPHCLNVENYVNKNNIKQKVQFISLEIHKQDNSNVLLEKAAACGIPQAAIGVPFLWDPSGSSTSTKCIIGDEPIINFFKDKIGL